MSVTDEVRERTDIVDLISQQVSLKKAGKTFKGNCPFHNEKTPSFYVYPDNWSYHCFGCGAHGNGFDFVMATQKMSFPEALRYLAQKAGVTIAERQVDAAQDREKDRLRDLHEAAAQYFHNLLLNSPAGQQARSYCDKRGLTRDTVEAFQLGYSLNSWEALGKYLSTKGFTSEEIAASGLLVEREDGSTFDRFRNRLMFPIRDSSGKICGFGGRALDDTPPKYMNSPDTLLFDKSATLYAIDKAVSAIRGRDLAVIVEGYMDAIMAHQYGYQNVIASMGTALTEKQIKILKRLSKNLALALDPDTAGDEATLRGLEVAKDAFDQKVIAIPTWQGYVHYEHRLDANIKIVTLPRGKDPDEIIRETPSGWAALVDKAQPTIDFLLKTVETKLDLADPRGKAQAVEQLLPIIKEIGDSVIRAHYIQRLARLVNVDEKLLSSTSTTVREPRRVRQDKQLAPGPKVAVPAQDRVEAYCLALLIQHPELQRRTDSLKPSYFSSVDLRYIYEMWLALPKLEDLMEKIGGDMREELTSLAGLPVLPMDSAMRLEELRSIVKTLEERHLKRMVKDTAIQLRNAQEASDEEQIRELQRREVELTSRLSEVERAHRAL